MKSELTITEKVSYIEINASLLDQQKLVLGKESIQFAKFLKNLKF